MTKKKSAEEALPMSHQEQYVKMQDSLNAARQKSAKDGRTDHDRNGEVKDLNSLVRLAGERIRALTPEASPQDQGRDVR